MTGTDSFPPPGGKDALEQGPALTPRFGPDGLIVCVAQDADTGAVLMVAHMNAEALRLTIETGIAHYWSRSRGELWRKGDTSGAVQHVREMRIDCDQDAVLIRIVTDRPEQTCHTGRPSCFYRVVKADPGGGGAARLIISSTEAG